MSVGPIQLIAFGFEDYEPSGKILRELTAQVDAGAIRVIDARIVRKDKLGHIFTTSMTGLSASEAMEFGAVVNGLLNPTSDQKPDAAGSFHDSLSKLESSFGLGAVELQNLAGKLPSGGAAAVLVIEHRWAAGFSQAVEEAGGTMLAQGFLTKKALVMVGEELEAQRNAAAAVQAANQAKIQAAQQAARAVALSEAVKAKAARDAVRALAEARLIEEAAVEEAALVIAAAFAVEVAAEQDAAVAVAASGEVVAIAAAEADAAVVEAEELIADADALAEQAIETAIEEREKRPTTSGHELSFIEGIGPAYAKQLKEAGVGSTMELLEQGATTSGRDKIARDTGISHKLILTWVNQADLFRIRGIGSEYAQLLEAAGVDTVVELATRNPENLHQKMVAVNEEKHLVRQVPSQSHIEDWIGKAKSLPRVVTY
jgi:predicted flap endonuclease-1-like 5' DNA nuclease